MTIKTAVAYARFSSDNQRAESIEAQLDDIREYARREGYTIIEEYTDEAKSATTDRRPEFQRMISDAQRGEFDTVLVFKLDRFSRDRYDFAYYKRLLKRNNVRIVSIHEQLSDDPESVILEAVLEGMAEYYSRNLSREIMRKGLLPNAKKCLFNGGRPPLGYDVRDCHYVINEYEAETVRAIFSMYADGKGYDKIIEWASSEGRTAKQGRPLSKSTIYDILHNERYKGVYIYNVQASKDADGRRSRRKRKDDSDIIRVPGGVPQIVSESVWDRAQEVLEANKHKENNARRTYLLTGKIFCGLCGSAMLGRSSTGYGHTYLYYDCGARGRDHTCHAPLVRAEVVEKAVVDAIYDNILAPESCEKFADKVIDYLLSVRQDSPKIIADLKANVTRIGTQIDGIITAITDGLYTSALKEKMQTLEAQRAQLRERIKEEEERLAVATATKSDVLEYIRSFGDIRAADPEDQKKAIAVFVDKIVINGDFADIHIISPTPDQKICATLAPGYPHQRRTKIIEIIRCAIRKKAPR